MKTMIGFAAIAVMTIATAASANVSTYSGITGPIEGPASYVEDGITTTSASGLFWGWPSPGEVHLDPDCCAGNSVTVTFTSSFNLVSFDISYAGDNATVTGFDAANSIVKTALISTNTLGTLDFSGFTNLTSLTITTTSDHFSFDNLTVSGAVPEPATWALMIGGFGLVGATMRRRRSAFIANA